MKRWYRSIVPALMASVLAVAAGLGHAQSQSYPSKPIRIVVPYPPGGFNDTLARTVGAKLQAAWGQPVVVDNRPGGGTVIGTDSVAKAPADGYTLLVLDTKAEHSLGDGTSRTCGPVVSISRA